MMKFGQTYYENLAVRTLQDFQSMFGYFSSLYVKGITARSCEKQSFVDVPQNRCSQNFCKVHRKTPAPESFFNKIVCLKTSTLL